MTASELKLQEFLKSTFRNVRSSKRVDTLHRIVIETFMEQHPSKYNFDFEVKIDDAFGGKFSTDICIRDSNNDPSIVFLVKCCNSSIGKNMKNLTNTVMAEAYRCTYQIREGNFERNTVKKVYFINIFPRKAPRFTTLSRFTKSKGETHTNTLIQKYGEDLKSGIVSGIDDVKKYKQKSNVSYALDRCHGDLVQNIDVYYDIDGIENKFCKSEFEFINPINIDPIKFDHPTI